MASTGAISTSTADLLLTLLAIVLVAIVSVVALFVLRRYRRKEAILPVFHSGKKLTPKRSVHRRISGLTMSYAPPYEATASSASFVSREKQDLFVVGASPPSSPLPEIRITFPEETGEDGKKTSGRVVVVHMSERGVGMEPVVEQLPAYQKDPSDRFQSLDLERIGGLKEKSTSVRA